MMKELIQNLPFAKTKHKTRFGTVRKLPYGLLVALQSGKALEGLMEGRAGFEEQGKIVGDEVCLIIDGLEHPCEHFFTH
jgi:hypothetical protein